jgi:hypothetical protein
MEFEKGSMDISLECNICGLPYANSDDVLVGNTRTEIVLDAVKRIRRVYRMARETDHIVFDLFVDKREIKYKLSPFLCDMKPQTKPPYKLRRYQEDLLNLMVMNIVSNSIV